MATVQLSISDMVKGRNKRENVRICRWANHSQTKTSHAKVIPENQHELLLTKPWKQAYHPRIEVGSKRMHFCALSAIALNTSSVDNDEPLALDIRQAKRQCNYNTSLCWGRVWVARWYYSCNRVAWVQSAATKRLAGQRALERAVSLAACQTETAHASCPKLQQTSLHFAIFRTRSLPIIAIRLYLNILQISDNESLIIWEDIRRFGQIIVSINSTSYF